MTQTAKLLKLAKATGLIRTRDLDKYGIPRWTLSQLRDSGDLVRVGRGIYRYARHRPTEHHTLVQACTRVPKGVVCLLSALRFHKLTTQLPREVWMAVPNHWLPKVDRPTIRFHYFSGDAYRAGIEDHAIEGRKIRVYNPAKTVVDCFKFRNKIGIDVALEALRDSLRGRKAKADDIWRYAKLRRMTTVMRPYMEAIA
jgi:predicted transcriptional regulator of viral defense system